MYKICTKHDMLFSVLAVAKAQWLRPHENMAVILSRDIFWLFELDTGRLIATWVWPFVYWPDTLERHVESVFALGPPKGAVYA